MKQYLIGRKGEEIKEGIKKNRSKKKKEKKIRKW